MSRDIVLPAGWVLGEDFDAQSAIVTVVAGDGVNATAPRIVVSSVVPPAARAYIERLVLRVVDQAGYDQLLFALRHRGARVHPWDRISGEQTVDEHVVDIGKVFEGGLLEIAASNISGTSESGASANAGDIRVIARLYGYLLRRV